jgi:MoaA/NifB/PqqE/SkfB family radical SAM enzyme
MKKQTSFETNIFKKIDADYRQQYKDDCSTLVDLSRVETKSFLLKLTMHRKNYQLKFIYKDQKLNYYDELSVFYISLEKSPVEDSGQPNELLLKNYLKILKRYDKDIEVLYFRAWDDYHDQSGKNDSLYFQNTFNSEKDIYKDKKIYQKEIRLFLTSKCNQKCKFCLLNKNSSSLEYGDIEKNIKMILRDNKNDADKILLEISGGEPTLVNGFIKAIRLLKKGGISRVQLQTNGVLLHKKKLVKEIYDAGLDWILLSFHDHRESSYNKITNSSGQFEKVLKAIENIADFPFKRLIFNFVINKHNYKIIPQYVSFLSKFKKNNDTELIFMPSAINSYLADAQYRDIAVKYSSAFPYLKKALLEKKLKSVDHLSGNCAMPICIGKSSKDFIDYAPITAQKQKCLYTDKVPQNNKKEEIRVKKHSCKKCIFDKNCQGVCFAYAEYFGLTELSPIKNLK